MHADCEVRNLGGDRSTTHTTDTPLTLIDVSFIDNDAPYDDYAMVSGWNDGAVITLENCTFDGNNGPNDFYMYSNATVFATGTIGGKQPLVYANYETEKNETVPAVAQAPTDVGLLRPEDPWFVAVQEVRPEPG